MRLTTSVIKSLKKDYPEFKFELSDDYLWSHNDKTIYYSDTDEEISLLFHELAHAVLGHFDYRKDVELLKMEANAWDKAIELAKKYDIKIDNTLVDSALDTYRDWLHARSMCKKCQATGLQIKKDTYKCLVCHSNWRVNEARTCSLRRYDLNTK